MPWNRFSHEATTSVRIDFLVRLYGKRPQERVGWGCVPLISSVPSRALPPCGGPWGWKFYGISGNNRRFSGGRLETTSGVGLLLRCAELADAALPIRGWCRVRFAPGPLPYTPSPFHLRVDVTGCNATPCIDGFGTGVYNTASQTRGRRGWIFQKF
jgi:hypothetical protein